MDVKPELVVLASVLVTVAGLLPNIDAAGGPSSRELAGLLSAVSPLIVLELYPVVKTGGVARIALVVICCYILDPHCHHAPASEMDGAPWNDSQHSSINHHLRTCPLLFYDLHWFDRAYVAAGAFVGYFSHLLLDGYGNLDLVGKDRWARPRRSSQR